MDWSDGFSSDKKRIIFYRDIINHFVCDDCFERAIRTKSVLSITCTGLANVERRGLQERIVALENIIFRLGTAKAELHHLSTILRPLRSLRQVRPNPGTFCGGQLMMAMIVERLHGYIENLMNEAKLDDTHLQELEKTCVNQTSPQVGHRRTSSD